MTYGNMPPDAVLNATRRFVKSLFWGPDVYVDAATLVYTIPHVKNAFSTVPYLAVTGPKGTGKTTVSADLPMLLASNFFAVDKLTSRDAIRNAFLGDPPPDCVGLDDASRTFGMSGTEGSTGLVSQLAVNSYRKSGKVSVSRNGATVNAPAYAVLFINGLGKLPDDIKSRAVPLALEPKPPEIRLQDALSMEVAAMAVPLKKNLHGWATSQAGRMQVLVRDEVPLLHEKLTDRRLQVFGPMAAVALAAGGDWPERWMNVFLSLGLDSSSRPEPTLHEQVLLHTAEILMTIRLPGGELPDRVFTADLVPALRDRPNGQVYRDLPTKFLVEELLPEALGPAAWMTGCALDGERVTGYGRMALSVLSAAAELKEMLSPVPLVSGPDRVQQEMTLVRAEGPQS